MRYFPDEQSQNTFFGGDLRPPDLLPAEAPSLIVMTRTHPSALQGEPLEAVSRSINSTVPAPRTSAPTAVPRAAGPGSPAKGLVQVDRHRDDRGKSSDPIDAIVEACCDSRKKHSRNVEDVEDVEDDVEDVEDDVEDDVEASRSGGWSSSWSSGWSGNGKTKCRVGGIVDKICHAINTKRCCKSRRPHKYKHGSGNKYRIASTSESADGIEARSGDRGGDRHNKHGNYGKDKHDRDRDKDVIKACCELFESDSHSKDHDAWRAAIAEVDARTGGGKKCKPPMHKLKKLCAKISNKCCQCEIDSEYKGKTYYTHKNVEGKVCIGKKSDYDTCCDVKGTEKCCKDGRCVDKQKGCGCPDTLPGIGETCSDACGCEGDTTNCVSGTCCPDTLPGDGETCSDACGCLSGGDCVSGSCCPVPRLGSGVSCPDPFANCCEAGLDCVGSAIGGGKFCCPTALPSVGDSCTDECGCASGICCFDLASIPSNPSKKCVDEKFCPCGICLITSGKDLYGTNTAYCANDAAASESCDKSCGSCSSGNGIGLEPVPVPLISNPPSFTGDACNDANSCTSFLPDLPKGVNPNSLCPQSQICVACKAEKTSQGQGCCLASGVFHPNDPDQACPA